MHKNKILEKLLAIILIFTLTAANPIMVTKSMAASLVETLFGTTSDGTGHENVGFEAYFGTEGEGDTSVTCDVNQEDVAIGMNIAVSNTGYLKDAKVEIKETEEGKGLNFKLKSFEELPEHVQSIDDNVIMLQQIDSYDGSVVVNLPIEYRDESYVNENKFSNDALVRFSGIYIDDNGDENPVSKDVTLRVNWKDSREVHVETMATKYIDYGRGIILQTLVKVNNETEGNTLPVEETNIRLNAPVVEGMTPSNVAVVANTTQGTNGELAGYVSFGDDNWNYNQEENLLTINVKNEKQTVEVNEFANEYLKEENAEVVEEERYYNVPGSDEYLITYTYDNVTISNEELSLVSNIDVSMETFSGVESDGYTNIVTNNNQYEYVLNGSTGDLVSLNLDNETESVSKAYAYNNYNNDGKYEVELNTKSIVNISYKDIINKLNLEDLESSYVDKEGNEIVTSDVYYKEVSISRDNFNEILGEEGEILINKLDGTTIASINKESVADENGIIVVPINERIDRLSYEISKPIAEGNLVIGTKKAMSNASIDKATLVNVSNIREKQILRADYSYVDSRVDVETSNVSIKMDDTSSKINVVLDRDSLSTLAVNNDVQLRIELNNAVDTSDVFGHSVFEIVLPEDIESAEVTSSGLINEEGLTIESVEQDGRVIRVTLGGVQEGINSGILTNGTNIVLTLNLKANLFTPAKADAIKVHYLNDNATAYADDGNEEVAFNYSAPTGVVAVNTISNYDAVGSVTTSVRQGTQEDFIDTFAEAKVATTEIIVMNNNHNTVSKVSILGRIPFEGVKDIQTGEDLNTTVDTHMVAPIVSDERNSAAFDVYYSANGEATADITDSNNGWEMNPETLENVKSYLIVPQDSEYEMQENEILRFTYQYQIPENLSHNENIFGTFLASYTNNSDVAVTEEQSAPDLVGLTTGEGPDVALNLTADRTSAKEYEEIEFNVTASNVGKERAEDIVVNFPVPEFAEFVDANTEDEAVEVTYENGVVKATTPALEREEGISFKVFVKATRRTGIIDETDPSSASSYTIKAKATLTARDIDKEVVAEVEPITVTGAEFQITLATKADDDLDYDVLKEGEELSYRVCLRNLTNKTINNIKITTVLPEEFEFVSATVIEYPDEIFPVENASYGSFDAASRVVTWDVGTYEGEQQENYVLNLKVAKLDSSITKENVGLKVSVSGEGTGTYESNHIDYVVGRPAIVISQTTDRTDTYVKEGETIKYIFSVKNEGGAQADAVKITDSIPDGLTVKKLSYVINGIVGNKKISKKDQAIVTSSIEAGNELVITVEAVASSLQGAQEKTVTNFATADYALTGEFVAGEARTVEAQRSNDITHIIEANEKNIVQGELESSYTSTYNGTTNTNSNIEKTYKVEGTAWEDVNKDGIRSIDEPVLSGIQVRLVDSESGVIKNSITTDSSGNYSFPAVSNGSYLVLFDYDTVKYTVTTYKKDGVGANVNSDVVTTKIEQDGKTRNAAITDIIQVSNGSVSGVDIGLVLADKFDLELDTSITKVMVQTAKGTENKSYDNIKLAKTEIAAKYVSGSQVIVEYEITVANKGDVKGSAKKIVDYVPNGMELSSVDTNNIWYTGSDGNVYTTALADTVLAPGEAKTIKLVLTKRMTTENTGIVNNQVEIADDYNIYGISDCNSTPFNKAQGENDMSHADIAILIKTGESLIYVSVIITTIILGSIAVFVAYTQIVLRKRKAGV